jgi:hypothetical protein
VYGYLLCPGTGRVLAQDDDGVFNLDSRTGLLRAARAGRTGRQYPSEQAQPASWPDDFAATELPLVTARMNSLAGAPPMTLTGPSALHIGTSPPADITGPPAALLAWLSGRSNGSGLHPDTAALPALPPMG